MAKRGTLVVRFIGDLKEFQASQKQMGTDLAKTGKAVDAGLTKPLGDANTAVTVLGKGFKTEATGITAEMGKVSASVGDISTAVKGVGSDVGKFGADVTADMSKVSSSVEAVGASAKSLGSDFKTEMGKVDSSVSGSRSELAQFSRDLDEIKNTKISPEIDDSKISSGLSSLSTGLKAGLAGVGLAAGAVLTDALLKGLDVEAATDKLAAQLALTEKQAKKSGQVAASLYAGAWGDSMEDVLAAVGAVQSSIPKMLTASRKDLRSATVDALNFASAFDTDIARAAQIAGQVVRLGFAKDASGAFDLLVSASQRVPAAVREDLLDAIDEYGPFFKTIGLSGEEAFSMLVAGAQKGMYGIDKTGDALKEFTIRASDMSTSTKQAFRTLGLDADDMADAIANGGEQGRQAFHKIVEGLLAIEDPQKRANTAIKLFGTPLEDLNVSEIPKFLAGLDQTKDRLGKVDGAARDMGKTLNDNTKTNMESFRRKLQTDITQALNRYALPALKGFTAYLNHNFGPTLRETSGAIGDFTETTRTVWDRWGDDLTRINDAVWGRITPMVTGRLQLMRGLFQTVTKVIRGDWQDLWSALVRTMRDALAVIIDKFLGFVQTLLDGADKAFGWVPGVGDKLGAAAEDFARFRERVNDQIHGIDSSKTIDLKIIPDDKFQAIISSGAGHPAWTGSHAKGGPITQGPPGMDWGNYRLMRGEHVWTTSEVSKAGGHGAMYRLRNMAETGALRGLVGMKDGGPVGVQQGVTAKFSNVKQATQQTGQIFGGVSNLLDQLVMLVKQSAVAVGGNIGKALTFARNQRGKPYNLGGVGPGSYDCSGFMSAITNVLRGSPTHRRVGSTGTFPWGGFVRGAAPRGFTIGSAPRYPGSSMGHMAGTLAGVNVESRGGDGVVVGPGARGYNDPGFSQVYHLAGLVKGGGSVGGGDTGALSRAEKWIIRHEAGGLNNVRANNPTSSAFGLGQLLEANRVRYARQLGFPVGIEYGDTGTTNKDHQIAMMREYIHERYGSAPAAVRFWKAHGWYGGGLQGGLFTQPTLIGVGERGPERVDVTPVGRGGRRRSGGGPVYLTLDVGGQSVTGILRGLVREELEDEFAYQVGGA
jgi:phage-related minor tail protein